MTYIPSQKEFESVIKLGVDKRTKHFVNMVGGHCYLWLLSDENGNLFCNYDEEGREILLVWPAKEYAECVLKSQNSTDVSKLKSIELHNFLEEYIDELTENNIYIFVFPNEELNGAIMTAESFRNMMQEELDRME